MVVERFSQSVLNSGIFRVYIATGFFATLIFFTLNSDIFTTTEILLGTIGVTILLKGLSNLMFSLVISFFSLENKKEEFDFKYNEEHINTLLNELNVNEAIDSGEKLKKAI
ncbi:hypothetical protein GCM10012288_08260 [Malaciobacter pacificus]|jgi:hypothetical protein|uniref:Putative membrane protein n=1 Tax=Malaciobacter pacificus TaxID=1080223 RepID=A0A5C2H8I6_9BACT|nr:hypothetical protein [Malaciobacter pacificus]QEP35123.1 putative membrane protein [Malaciobacter pacificus]GGD36587.1 hypothetical protein GCM10012288_08260 [Malaciobacter pacificus]